MVLAVLKIDFRSEIIVYFLATNVRLIAEALACTIYNYKESACQGTMFDENNGSNYVSKTHIKHWSDYLSSTPRFSGLMSTNKVCVKLSPFL